MNIFKELAINALFWTGIVAIILTLFESNYYFLLFFIGLFLFNLLVIFIVQKLAPELMSKENISLGPLQFRLKPIAYPKILDEERRAYLPEFIHLNITSGSHVLFAGNLARGVVKQLRDSLDQVLKTEEAKTTTVKAKGKVKQRAIPAQ